MSHWEGEDTGNKRTFNSVGRPGEFGKTSTDKGSGVGLPSTFRQL